VAHAVHAADDNIDCPHLEILMTKLPGWWRRPDTEFQATFRDAFAEQLRRVGFVVTPHAERLERVPPWYVSTQVLDIGDGTIVWSWELKKQPTVISGSLHFDRFADPRGEITEEFSGIQGLSRLSIQDFATTAIEASNEIAAVFLPHARRLCSDRNAALLAQQGQLERMRESLEQEIQRVRQQRAERQRTTLTIEAEER